MQASVGDIPTEASHDPPPQGLLQIASQPPVPSNGQLGGASFLLETGTTCERCYIGKVKCSRGTPCTRCERLGLVCKPHCCKPSRPRGSTKGSTIKRSQARRLNLKHNSASMSASGGIQANIKVNSSTVDVVNATSMSSGHEELTSHTDWLEELVALGALSSEMNESSSDMAMGVPLPPPGLLAPSLDVQAVLPTIESARDCIHEKGACKTFQHPVLQLTLPQPPGTVVGVEARRPLYDPPQPPQQASPQQPQQPAPSQAQQLHLRVRESPPTPQPSPPGPVPIHYAPAPPPARSPPLVPHVPSSANQPLQHPRGQRQQQPQARSGASTAMGPGTIALAAPSSTPSTGSRHERDMGVPQAGYITCHHSNQTTTAAGEGRASDMADRVTVWLESTSMPNLDRERAAAIILAWHWQNLQIGCDRTLGMLEPLRHVLRLSLPPTLPSTGLPYSGVEEEHINGRLAMLFEGLTSLHAMCSLRWGRGNVHVTTTERFSSVFLTTRELENALVTQSLSPLHIWAKLVEGERSLTSYWDAALRSIFSPGGVTTAQNIQVVDRFGWHYTMTMRLGTYASRCGWYSYYVLILGPTQ